MLWIIAAILSAVFAGLTSILAKCGIKKTDSDLATALRTLVVLAFSWIMVFIVGSQNTLGSIDKSSLLFLVLSGLATGASWICYFKALAMGDVNKVVPIDKSSTILTVLLAIICFGETSNLAFKLVATLVLAVGIFLMVEKKQTEGKKEGRAWMLYALLSAVFAALTSILAKVGIKGIFNPYVHSFFSTRKGAYSATLGALMAGVARIHSRNSDGCVFIIKGYYSALSCHSDSFLLRRAQMMLA